MKGLSKPIPEANYKGKKRKQKMKKIQRNGKSFKILLLWWLGVSGWPLLTEGGKRQKKKKWKHQDVPSDRREEEAEAKEGTRGGGEEEARMPNPRISSDS